MPNLKWPLAGLFCVLYLWLVFRVYLLGQPLWAIGLLILGCAGLWIYTSSKAVAARYVFPGAAGMLLFVAFPIVYTTMISFTNYSSANLLSFERASAYLSDQVVVDDDRALGFTVHASGAQHRVALAQRQDDPRDAPRAAQFVSAPLSLTAPVPGNVPMAAATPQDGSTLGVPLALKDVLQLRSSLMALKLQLPDQSVLSYSGVREFAPTSAVWRAGADGSIQATDGGKSYAPNHKTGFFEDAQGQRLQPGFSVAVGWANYVRMIADKEFRGPFMAIFVWTCLFALLTVIFSTALGLGLAVVLNWEGLRFRTAYRTLLFLPYAVPGFISILVFKGLFNQNFGEINVIFNALFGVKPAWFADPLLAKIMLLVVNVWLGYAYFMVLCTGLIKAIPADLYEASAIAGAGPLTNLFKITAPLIIKPLAPLLISAFAFNFNNFVLIALLTDGRPDFLNTKIPAGTTDILVSYTYRIAFKDSGQDFGLAAAISTMIFLLVAAMSLAQLKFSDKGNKR